MSQSSASALTGHDKVTACIDGSAFAVSVCDAAVWASQRLSAPLSFLHVIDRQEGAGEASSDLSGSIGLGAREHLLEELAVQRCLRPWPCEPTETKNLCSEATETSCERMARVDHGRQ